MPVGQPSETSAFDPAQPGTAEAIWRATLAYAPGLELPTSSILIVSPHPDDEVLGAGGLISRAAAAGLEVTILSVTDGEAAYPDWNGLGKLRRREVVTALNVLAPVNLAPVHLGVPDGRITEHTSSLRAAIDDLSSSTTLIVGPYERDGHPDHDAAGEACREIASRRGLTLWRYPIWTWHHTTPEAFTDMRWGRLMLDAGTVQAKTDAMTCFDSQMRPTGRAPIVPNHVLPYFTRPYEAFLL